MGGHCDHPSATIPEVGALKSLVVRAPGGHKVHDLLSSVDGITVEEGDPMLEFSFGSPEGTIPFSADNPQEIKFPEFEEGDTGASGAPAKPDLLPTGGGNSVNSDDVDISDSDSD